MFDFYGDILKKIIFKSISALLLIGASTVALADTTYVTCYYNNDKKWEWGLNKEGGYQQIAGNWKKTPNTNVDQFHVIKDWSKKDLADVCKRTLEQKGINSQVTGIYAADSNAGSNYEIIYKEPAPAPAPTKKLSKLVGKWKSINRCKGDSCDSIQVSYTVGVEKGKAIEKSSSIGMALGISLGVEAEALGVGKVSAGFTSELSSEQTESIMNSFTQSKSQSIQITCKGPSEFWQWVSIATINNGTQTETIEANSDLVACALIGKGPKGTDLHNPAWSP